MTETDEKTRTQAPAPNVWPTFRADDAPALVAFLVDVVGFRKTAYYATGDQVDHAQLDWPEGGGVMLGSRRDNGIESGLASIYVVTDHVDEIHERVKEAPGVRIVRPLADPDYGGREFVMTDPEGNFWSFGTYRGQPSAEA